MEKSTVFTMPWEEPLLPRCEWSLRRWAILLHKGSAIFHRVPGAKRDKGQRPVPSHRLIPIDRTRYPYHVMRGIRATPLNFRGEVRR